MSRNYGLRSRNGLPAGEIPTHSCQLGGLDRPSLYLKETVSGGFLIAFITLVLSLFGIIVFGASLLIEPSLDTKLVSYERSVRLDR